VRGALAERESVRCGLKSQPELFQKKEQIYLTAEQVEQAVRKLYSDTAYIVLSQVRNGTGFAKAPRTADMLAISTWPSRGLYAIGIEIKVNKYDLIKELANPKKAEEIAKNCKHWFVAIPEGLDDDIIIPADWGIITVNAKLKAKIQRTAVLKPVPMDELFVCSILRNYAENYIARCDIQKQIDQAVEAETKNIKALQSSRLSELEQGVAKFKEHSGIDLLDSRRGHFTYYTKDIGEAIKLLTALRSQPGEEIKRARESLSRGLEAVDAALSIMEQTPLLVERSETEQGGMPDEAKIK
jgi:hypothetical protein